MKIFYILIKISLSFFINKFECDLHELNIPPNADSWRCQIGDGGSVNQKICILKCYQNFTSKKGLFYTIGYI